MADFDIGTLLFRDILRVTFTSSGNPINDLVMYFFIPTVFMILFVVIITSKLPYLQNSSKMRLLFAIAVYLYIIFGGYFQFFVSLSGPVLMILIFFLGILFFIGGHFGGGKKNSSGSKAQNSGDYAAFATGRTEGEILHQYELLSQNYANASREYEELKRDSKDNPALDRLLAVQKETMSSTKNELIKIEVEIQKMKLGGGFENNLRQIKHRYGIK
ncbi:MAG: hypothetical protein NT129_00010 [Candidatus Aenigmarchaeota archaeon]|nr:hypothetical protein [Candidatus Aenigmarchaeota archaeon]